MQRVEPQVAHIASTKLNYAEVARYLKDIGAEEYQLDEGISDAEQLVIIAGKACYKSFVAELNPNVRKVRDDPQVYLDNIHKTGHGSVTEHASDTFMFWNVSRVFTHELVRHRIGVAMSQESLRYVRLTELQCWLPSCITENPAAVKIFEETFEYLEKRQLELAELYGIDAMKSFAKKKVLTSAFRRIAPIGLATAIMWTMNIRTARHIIQIRTSRFAEEEIRLVFDKVAEIMTEKHPLLFQDFVRLEYEGIGEWVAEYAAMPYDNEKLKVLVKELELLKSRA